MRRAFTLIELLVVVAIMATMVTVGVVSLNSSRGSSQVFGAARDVMAMVRRARSLALVTQKPVIIKYTNEKDGDDSYARIEIKADRLFASRKNTERVQTLSGETVGEPSDGGGDGASGETLEDVLSPEYIPSDIVKGLKVKVLDESDQLNLPENETRQSKISIFSTADNVSRTFDAKTTASAAEDSSAAGAAAAKAAEPTVEEEFTVAFAVNGTVNPPHRIWIYRDGQTPEKGLCIRVDRFGEPKCDDVE